MSFTLTSPLDTILHSMRFIYPKDYELTLLSLFFKNGFFIKENGSITEFLTPFRETFLLNGHIIENPVLGQFNLMQLPSQFFEIISITKCSYGNAMRSIELLSKIPQYTIPFSHLYFTLFSDNTVYNIDFTRPISPNLFFYISGFYSKIFQPAQSFYLKTNGIYTNLYYNYFTPMRLIFFYTSNNYGLTSNLSFCDVSLNIGGKNHQFILYYTLNGFNLIQERDGATIANSGEYLGIMERSSFKVGNSKLRVEIGGRLKRLKSEIYGSEYKKDINLNPQLQGSFKRFIYGLSAQMDIEEESSYHINPGLNWGYNLIDSLFLIMKIQKSIHKPAFFQKLGIPSVFGLSYILNPNHELAPEKVLLGEMGIERKNLFLNFYKMDISDCIYYEKDSSNYYTARNRKFGSLSGLEGYLAIPLISIFSLDLSGNYLFRNSSIQFLPEANFNITLLWHRITSRATFDFGPMISYIGKRRNLEGINYEPLWAISALAKFKFVSLYFSVILDNILNEKPADIPNEQRRFAFVVKWEFWD